MTTPLLFACHTAPTCKRPNFDHTLVDGVGQRGTQCRRGPDAADPQTQLQGVPYEVTVGVIADNLINIAQALEASPAFCAGK
jgi:hypothetical protein